jgi:hypothetical protein
MGVIATSYPSLRRARASIRARCFLALGYYSSVSLADLIQNSAARSKLKHAEAAAASGDLGSAVTDCGNAFDIVFAAAREKHQASLVGESDRIVAIS